MRWVMNFNSVVESILFVVGDEGITLESLSKIIEKDSEFVKEVLKSLALTYKDSNRGIDIALFGNRYKLVTKKESREYIQKLVDIDSDENLSESSLEVLAIIAYNQPVTRVMIDEIRGISSSYLVRKLLYKNLICEVGRSELAGRPILYGTTQLFLDYFGLTDIKDLPKLEIEEKDEVKDLYNSRYNEENV